MRFALASRLLLPDWRLEPWSQSGVRRLDLRACGHSADVVSARFMEPKRIQLRRTGGWRMPPNTSKIDRSTRWGNPFRIGQNAVHPVTGRIVKVQTAEVAVSLFAIHLRTTGAKLAEAARGELRGRNLACWCKSESTCHGDVLLQIANAPLMIKKAA
jgi:Domain of unknown function (DUF4326)